MSEAEGSFSAATQETEKKTLQRSGTKAKIGKGRAAGANGEQFHGESEAGRADSGERYR